jgi:hypothetical protein
METWMGDRGNFVIKGVTAQGDKFRPGDWAERLASVLADFGEDHRESFSPLVRPLCVEGLSCILVDGELAEKDPLAYCFVLDFAKDNDLVISQLPQAAGEGAHLVVCPPASA